MLTQAEIRATITDKIIKALNQGVIPWRRPWLGNDGPRLPTNFVTHRAYNGVNIMLLWLAAQQHGYPVDFWGSYQQWRAIGAHVKHGEKATQIVFWKPIKKTVRDKNGEEHDESFPLLRTWSIFNIAQAEGGSIDRFKAEPKLHDFRDADRAEFDRVVRATKADIRFGGEKAVYHRPPADYIELPKEGKFLSFPAYAETTLHEVGHWSESRLGWTGSYAEGELRAEIGACFLVSALGIPDSGDLTNHASYVASWLRELKNDPKYIFRASAAASKAADFILSFSRPKEEAETVETTGVAG